jgi:hypothetical protein
MTLTLTVIVVLTVTLTLTLTSIFDLASSIYPLSHTTLTIINHAHGQTLRSESEH